MASSSVSTNQDTTSDNVTVEFTLQVNKEVCIELQVNSNIKEINFDI